MRKLLSSDASRIGRFDTVPKPDVVPASLVSGTAADLKAGLVALLGKKSGLHRVIDLVR
jgi:hypothetical protein